MEHSAVSAATDVAEGKKNERRYDSTEPGKHVVLTPAGDGERAPTEPKEGRQNSAD